MTKFLFAATILAGLTVAAPVSAAQYVFSFTTETPLIGGAVTGNGVFTTSDTAVMVGGRTAFAITSISGMVNGSAIVAPTGNYGNYFTGPGPFLDGSGLRFFTAANNDVRFFFQDSVSRYRVNTFSPGSSSFVTANSSLVAPIPEPATWAMMLAGFLMVGMGLRYGRRSTSVRFA
jgi:hypothetical protein